MARYTIELSEDFWTDMEPITASATRVILDDIEKQLNDEPLLETRRKKPLDTMQPEWWDLPLPVWQLRVGEHRVWYAVDGETVIVARAFFKGRLTTGEAIE